MKSYDSRNGGLSFPFLLPESAPIVFLKLSIDFEKTRRFQTSWFVENFRHCDTTVSVIAEPPFPSLRCARYSSVIDNNFRRRSNLIAGKKILGIV
ncbi:MAG: hypothetical protein ABIR03_02375 [Ginsengibacter sp.]